MNTNPAKKIIHAASPASNNSNKKKPVDTTKSITFTTNLQKAEQDLLSDFIIRFQKPLQHFDSAKIILSDTNFRAIPNYRITADTSLTIFHLTYPWKEDAIF